MSDGFYKSIYEEEYEVLEQEIERLRSRQRAKLYKIKRDDWEKKREYSNNFTRSFKRKIIKRDGGQCQFPNCSGKKDLTVHHIFYLKKNTDENSCITLCRRHNGVVNALTQRNFWTEYFRRLIHYKLSRQRSGDEEDEEKD
jgi:hypothetical protein